MVVAVLLPLRLPLVPLVVVVVAVLPPAAAAATSTQFWLLLSCIKLRRHTRLLLACQLQRLPCHRPFQPLKLLFPVAPSAPRLWLVCCSGG